MDVISFFVKRTAMQGNLESVIDVCKPVVLCILFQLHITKPWLPMKETLNRMFGLRYSVVLPQVLNTLRFVLLNANERDRIDYPFLDLSAFSLLVFPSLRWPHKLPSHLEMVSENGKDTCFWLDWQNAGCH